jgi:hypothetical protein
VSQAISVLQDDPDIQFLPPRNFSEAEFPGNDDRILDEVKTSSVSKRDLEVEIVHRPTKDATASPKAKAKTTAKNLPAKVESHLAKKGLDASTLNSAARDLYRKIRDDDTASLHLKELANMLRINARLIRDLSAALDKSWKPAECMLCLRS